MHLSKTELFSPWMEWHHCSTGSHLLISHSYTWKLVCKWEAEWVVGSFSRFSPKQFGRACMRAMYETNGTHASIILKEQWASVLILFNAKSLVFFTRIRFLVHACFWRKMTYSWIIALGWCHILFLPRGWCWNMQDCLMGTQNGILAKC